MSFRQSVLARRILTVAIILPLFLAALFWLPRPLWGAATLLVVLAACSEWSALIGLAAPARIAFTVVVAAACAVLAFAPSSSAGVLVLGVALAFWLVLVPLWMREALAAGSVALAVGGALVLVSAWYSLYLLQASAARLLVLLGVVWVADTAAYLVGRRFGRRKLAPRISPGKTWEGVLGAVAGVGVYHALIWHAWSPGFLAGDAWADLVVVAGMLMLSIEGDLFESWIKRRAGVKDSGTLLPGHGGVLDRIDGVVAALPLAALGAALGAR